MWDSINNFLLTILFYVFLFSIPFIVVCWKSNRLHRVFKKMKGPKYNVLWGNVNYIGNDPTNLLSKFKDMERVYGTKYPLLIGPLRLHIIMSSKLDVESVLSSEYIFEKSSDFQHTYFNPWFREESLIKSENRKQIRQIVFNSKDFENFVNVFIKHGNIFMDCIKPYASSNKNFDIQPFVGRLAFDIICECILEDTINAQIHRSSEYIQAVDDICAVVTRRIFSAWKCFDFLFQYTEDYRIQKESLKILHDFSRKAIQDKRKQINKLHEKLPLSDMLSQTQARKMSSSFLDILMNSEIYGKQLTDEMIGEEVDNFLYAGYNAIASTISFAIHVLANKPSIQFKVLKEQMYIFGPGEVREAQLQDLKEMRYLDNVILEVLRLYPGAPFITRKLKCDTKIYASSSEHYCDGFKYPEGSILTLMIYLLHRNPELYPNPEEFIPERFEEDFFAKKHEFTYVPFDYTLIDSIGKSFALTEIKTIISKLIRNYELIAGGPETELQLSPEFVLKSKNGVQIKLLPRKFSFSTVDNN